MHRNGNSDNTALHLAAAWGYLSTVKWLVEEANLEEDAPNKCGNMALHLAASWGENAVVHYLSFSKEVTGIRNKDGQLYNEVPKETW